MLKLMLALEGSKSPSRGKNPVVW